MEDSKKKDKDKKDIKKEEERDINNTTIQTCLNTVLYTTI